MKLSVCLRFRVCNHHPHHLSVCPITQPVQLLPSSLAPLQQQWSSCSSASMAADELRLHAFTRLFYFFHIPEIPLNAMSGITGTFQIRRSTQNETKQQIFDFSIYWKTFVSNKTFDISQNTFLFLHAVNEWAHV